MCERVIQTLGDAVAATRPSEGTGEHKVRKATYGAQWRIFVQHVNQPEAYKSKL